MGAVKNLAWDQATEFLSKVEDDLTNGKITKEKALDKLTKTNYNIALEGITNSDDAEEWIDIVVKETQSKVQKLRTEAVI